MEITIKLVPEQFCFAWYIAVVVLSFYVWHFCSTRLRFFVKGGIKYRVALFMSNYIYLGKFGLKQTLTLDGNDDEKVYKLRLKGVDYLADILNRAAATVKNCNMTDCRFKKIKVLFPLLRELELPTPNFIKKIESHQVVLDDDSKRFHVGCDAVHFFNQKFHNELNAEVFKKLETNTTQYSFTSLTPELMRHSERIAKLTKTDEVRYCLSGSEAVDVRLLGCLIETCASQLKAVQAHRYFPVILETSIPI